MSSTSKWSTLSKSSTPLELFTVGDCHQRPSASPAVTRLCTQPCALTTHAYGLWHTAVRLPLLRYDATTLAGRTPAQLVSISCTINSGGQSCTLHGCSLPLVQYEAPAGQLKVATNPAQPWRTDHAMDFQLQYSIASEEIVASLLWDKDYKSFCMIVSPPTSGAAAKTLPEIEGPKSSAFTHYAKHIFFLIDRSGSMNGLPMEQAKQALCEAIAMLSDIDFFNIIQYDHEQEYWQNEPVPASSQNRSFAIDWVHSIRARGMTDIFTPLRNALELLENTPVNTSAGMNMPFIFLVTDGAVENEREICQCIGKNTRTRIVTMGIGMHCNYYFLQMLALVGRGFCEIAYEASQISAQITSLVNAANVPLLTDVSLDLADVKTFTLYPFPIPDLFLGAPLIISGQYEGDCKHTFRQVYAFASLARNLLP
eukprot:SAG31_NODE_3695_length_3980_cov_6.104870_2_plen_425_part_00